MACNVAIADWLHAHEHGPPLQTFPTTFYGLGAAELFGVSRGIPVGPPALLQPHEEIQQAFATSWFTLIGPLTKALETARPSAKRSLST